MIYEGTIYRPPSEAYSLIIQHTIGCARNDCTFCSMYKDKKFRIRKPYEVIADLEDVRRRYRGPVDKIFLADGDALIAKTEDLLTVLGAIKRIYPECERVTSYGAPADILQKSPEELAALNEAGLKMVYVGLESGDDVVLKNVKKGVTAAEIVEAGKKLRASGIKLSLTVISGLGGRARLKEHAILSAKCVSEIKPEYLGFLTLMVIKGTPLYDDVQSGRFELLCAPEVAEEMILFLENVDSEGTVFRSNHISNYINLRGTFNRDNARLIAQVKDAMRNEAYKPEFYRQHL
ncbi:MAG: B12-binding domain-containing radical SAM protein [Clostridia bacterium]|nr:B12-binding domain-containing radical SAM protein [Clostridia bacterium]